MRLFCARKKYFVKNYFVPSSPLLYFFKNKCQVFTSHEARAKTQDIIKKSALEGRLRLLANALTSLHYLYDVPATKWSWRAR